MHFLNVETVHTQPIVCCSSPNPGKIVASGCEGGLLSFSSLGSRECIDSINFGSNNVCMSVQASQKDPWAFFCSVGNLIYLLDIRKGFEKNSAICERCLCGDDEINSIALNLSETWIAAGDDDGEIYCFNMTDEIGMEPALHKRPSKILRRGHQNICSSVLFSKLDQNSVLSAGLDCVMIRWNLMKLKIGKKWIMPNITTSGQKALNPPMIHSIDSCLQEDENKELVAVGRGDGSIAIYDASARNQSAIPKAKKSIGTSQLANPDMLAWMAFPEDGCHTSACNAVRFSSRQDSSGFGEQAFLLSAGNDKSVKIWDWRKDTPLVDQISNEAKINCIAGLYDHNGSDGLGIIGDLKGMLRIVSE